MPLTIEDPWMSTRIRLPTDDEHARENDSVVVAHLIDGEWIINEESYKPSVWGTRATRMPHSWTFASLLAPAAKPAYGTIRYAGYERNDDSARPNIVCERSSSEVRQDCALMDKALEFKYAARRQNKVLVVDMVPRWVALVIGFVFRVRVGE